MERGALQHLSRPLRQDGSHWAALTSALLGVRAGWEYISSCSTELRSFPHRAMGDAILKGVDPTVRYRAYLVCLILVPLVFTIAFAALRMLHGALRDPLKPAARKRLAATLSNISGVALVLSLTALFVGRRDLLPLTDVLLYLVVMVLLERATHVGFGRVWQRSVVHELPRRLSLLCAFLPVFVFFFARTAAGDEIFFSHQLLAYHALCTLVLWLAFHLLLALRFDEEDRRATLNERLALAGTPLFLIPLCPIVGSELGYAAMLSGRATGSARAGLYLIFAALTLSCLVFFSFPWLRQRIANSVRALCGGVKRALWYPAAVATVILYRCYLPLLDWKTTDLLHPGNFIVPFQQLHDFHSIPFVDALYPEGLSSIIPGLLFTALNGFENPLDFYVLVWPLSNVMDGVLIYAVLSIFFSPLLALLALLFLPFGILFKAHHGFLLLPGLLLVMVNHRASLRRWLIFWLGLALSVLWLPAIAPSAVAGALVATALLALSRAPIRLAIGSKALALVGGISLAGYVLLLVLRGPPLGELMTFLQGVYTTERIISNYAALYHTFSPVVMVQYALLPLACVISLALVLLKLARGERLEPRHILLSYLAAAGLVLFLRVLGRHCLVEGFYESLLCFVAVVLPLVALKQRGLGLAGSSLVLILFSANLGVEFSPQMKFGSWFDFHQWRHMEARVVLGDGDRQRFGQLKSFFDRNMVPQQTFAEFISGQLLYPLTRRELPFFHSVHFLQSDGPQRAYVRQWGELIPQKKIPYVILNSTRWWGGNIDGVPHTMAAYRISEFIYQHYRPHTKVYDFEIWKQKGVQASALPTKEPPRPPRIFQEHPMRRLAYIWGTHDHKRAAQDTRSLAKLLPEPMTLKPRSSFQLTVNEKMKHRAGNYLHFQIRAKEPSEIQVTVEGEDGGDSGVVRFDVLSSPRPADYLVRISSLWAFHAHQSPRLKIVNSGSYPVNVERIVIRQGD